MVAVDLIVSDDYRPEVDQLLRGVTAGVAYGGLGGFLAARRPQLSVGWVMLLIGFSNAFSSGTAVLADRSLDGDSGLTSWAFWLSSWSWVPGYVLVPTVLLLILPNGHPYSRFGRALVAVASVGTGLVTLAWALTPYDQQDYALPDRYAHLTNPVGVDGTGVLLPVALAAVMVGMVAGLVTLALRLRTSRGHEREQVYWVLAGALLTVLLLVGAFAFPDASDVIIAVAMLPLPLAITWSSVRRRLWDLDLVVNKTLVLVILGAVGVVVGSLLPVPAAVAAAVAVVVALPLLGPVQQLVNRFLYRDATEPTEAVQRLGEQVGATTSPHEALPHVLSVVASTLGTEHAEVRLTDGTTVCHGEPGGDLVVVPLVHHQVPVGVLAVAVPPGGLGARGEAAARRPGPARRGRRACGQRSRTPCNSPASRSWWPARRSAGGSGTTCTTTSGRGSPRPRCSSRTRSSWWPRTPAVPCRCSNGLLVTCATGSPTYAGSSTTSGPPRSTISASCKRCASRPPGSVSMASRSPWRPTATSPVCRPRPRWRRTASPPRR